MKKPLFILFLAVILLVLTSCSKSNDNNISPNTINPGSNKGDIAPDFSGKFTDGNNFKLSDYKGNKPVLIYFWATWCPYCKKDFDAIKIVYPKYKDSIEFIAMDLDSSENEDVIKNYINKRGLQDIKFTVTQPDVLAAYGVVSTTTKYAVGRNGIIIWKGSGDVDSNTWEIIFKGLQSS